MLKTKSIFFLDVLKIGKVHGISDRRKNKPLIVSKARKTIANFNKIVGVLQPIRKNVMFKEDVLNQIKCWNIKGPEDSKKVILYLHGGGYIFGLNHLSNFFKYFMAELSKSCEAEVWAPDYRLAPEYPFPAAIEDCYQAYLGLLEKGIKAENIYVMGDSAGGGLALSLLLKLKDERKRLPKAVVSLSPWTDLAVTGKSIRERADLDPILEASSMAAAVPQIVNPGSIKDPYISPLYGSFKGLPPLMILVGGREILYDDAIRVAEKARKAGVSVTLDINENMIHSYPLFGGILREGSDAIQRIAEFLHKVG